MYRCPTPNQPNANLWRVGIAGLVLAATGALAACGSSETPTVASLDNAVPSASASASQTSSDVSFAQCMRENGLKDFKDPSAGGSFSLQVNPNDPVAKKALKACQSQTQTNFVDGGSDTRWMAAQREYSKCMRAQGLTDFPDPGPDGAQHLTGPIDAAFKAADAVCREGLSKAMTGHGPAQ